MNKYANEISTIEKINTVPSIIRKQETTCKQY